MSAIKIDLTNSERLYLLRLIKEEARYAEGGMGTTASRLEKIYGIRDKLEDKRPTGLVI
jgi:hypothetical protein